MPAPVFSAKLTLERCRIGIATGRLVLVRLEHVLAPSVRELETARNAQLQHQAPPCRGITELAPILP